MDLVTQVFSEVLRIPPEEVIDSLSYQSFERWDSVNHMKIMARLADALEADFTTEDIIGMETVGKVREILNKYANQQSPKKGTPLR